MTDSVRNPYPCIRPMPALEICDLINIPISYHLSFSRDSRTFSSVTKSGEQPLTYLAEFGTVLQYNTKSMAKCMLTLVRTNLYLPVRRVYHAP